MNQPTLPRLALALFLIVLIVPVTMRAATVKVVNMPTSGANNAPVLLVVVADAYAANEEQEFNYDVENFVKYGLLLDDFYKGKMDDMVIVSYFDHTPPGQQSKYDFTIGPGAGNCAVKAGPKTTDNLEAILTSVNPVPSNVHFIVIGNHPYNIGCTDGMWTYVGLDAVGTDVLQHELGHYLGKLFDEWTKTSNSTTPYPGSIPAGDKRNCWPGGTGYTGPAPHWIASGVPGSGQIKGCDLYAEGVVHAFQDTCRMDATNKRKFCAVCLAALDLAFADMRIPYIAAPPRQTQQTLPQLSASHQRGARADVVRASYIVEQPSPVPPPAAPTSRPILRLLVQFDPGRRPQAGPPPVAAVPPSLTVKRKTFVTGIYAPSYTNTGEFMYEIKDGGQIKEIGILPDHVLTARGYRAGSGQHATSAPHATDVVIPIPDMTLARFNTSNLTLTVYRVPRSITQRVINIEDYVNLRLKHPFERVVEAPIPVK